MPFILLIIKKGSVHDIPKNISLQKYECEPQDLMFRFPIPSIQEEFIDTGLLSKVVRLIHNSKKPILYVGQGCNHDHELLTKFVEITDIPVTTTIHANGVYDETKEKSLRWWDMHGSAAKLSVTKIRFNYSTWILFDDRTTGEISKYAPEAMKAFKEGRGGIVHINIEKDEINKVINTHYNFNNSCKKFLEEIIPKLGKVDRTNWVNHAKILKDKHPFKLNKSSKID